MSEEYEDQELDAIHKQVGEWFDCFVKSSQFEALTETQRNEASEIIRFFAEYSFRYIGMAPANWNRGGLTECCVDVLPRKVTAELAFFEAMAPVLSAFFTFLAEKSLLKNARALAKTVAELHEAIVAASQDRRYWGPAKTFMMAAQEAGVDLCDQKALDRFMVTYNLQHLARQQEAPRMPAPPATSLLGPAVPIRRSEPKVGRNDPCPCGSGKKFKKCCGG